MTEDIENNVRHSIFTSGYLAGQQESEKDLDRMKRRLTELATESRQKGEALQKVKELNLVGNAYVGMAQRILEAIKGEE